MRTNRWRKVWPTKSENFIDYRFAIKQEPSCFDYVGQRHYFSTYSQYCYPICSRPEVDSDVVSGIFMRQMFSDKAMKLGDHLSVKPLPEIGLKVVWYGILQVVFAITSYLKQLVNVIFSAAIEKGGLDVRVKFGDSRSNYNWVIQHAHLVKMKRCNRRRRWQKVGTSFGVLPKKINIYQEISLERWWFQSIRRGSIDAFSNAV